MVNTLWVTVIYQIYERLTAIYDEWPSERKERVNESYCRKGEYILYVSITRNLFHNILTHLHQAPHISQIRLGLPSVKNALRWQHNGRYSVSNHQPHDCLLNRLFRRRSKKTWKLWVTGLCAGNSSGTGEFPAKMVSWWRHHGPRISSQLSVHWNWHILYSHERCYRDLQFHIQFTRYSCY